MIAPITITDKASETEMAGTLEIFFRSRKLFTGSSRTASNRGNPNGTRILWAILIKYPMKKSTRNLKPSFI